MHYHMIKDLQHNTISTSYTHPHLSLNIFKQNKQGSILISEHNDDSARVIAVNN